MTGTVTPNAKPAAVKKAAAKKSPVAVKKTVTAATKAKAVKPEKKDKPHKVKMVRDSFSMTEGDYENLLGLKKKCLAAGVHVKKSELLRVGLVGLMKLSNAVLLTEVKRIAAVKSPKAAKS